MMQLYPADAGERLEFSKVCALLLHHCKTDLARQHVGKIKFHTKLEYLEADLLRVQEMTLLYSGSTSLPIAYTHNIEQELKLLSIANACLSPEQFLMLKNLSLAIRQLLQWYKNHHTLYPHIAALLQELKYEPRIESAISAIIDDGGQVKDTASPALAAIRAQLAQQRAHLRKVFDGVLRKLSKQGYLADIAEGYLNGRRTVAVLAEHKRIVKGIFHGESDSGKTVFIEPEETIELNNEINTLSFEETKEVQRILHKLTATLMPYQSLLQVWYELIGLLDFIRAKAGLALDMNAHKPLLTPHPGIHLVDAVHPLLLLHNKSAGKQTIPTTIALDRKNRILIISGPNAGGKTVTMKTVGLLQLMTQAGLLIPAAPHSEVGLFKQLMIHIGDTQSIEHELSTYSAHLRDMKHFTDFANGKTLFFIDELGSGSDPNLGGAFAEAIVEELAARNAIGIITTHYLNLKVMAGKVAGIVNGAMTFDETRLLPLYQLAIGKPGSSYTFAIAQRSQLSPKIIARAKNIADRGHFKLDKMLLQTEKQSVVLQEKEKHLNQLLKENEQLKKEYETLADKEKKQQHFATLKLQNKIRKEELDYLRDTERKFKQIIIDWKKADNKQEVIKAAEKVLFRKKQLQANEATAKKADKRFETVGGLPKEGDWIRHKNTHQVGVLKTLNGKRSIVQIGKLPFTVDIAEWIVVKEKNNKEAPKKNSKQE